MKNILFAVLKEMTGAPAEFQVLPEGKIELNGEKPVHLDEQGAQEIIAAFKARGNDMVIDYEHQTLSDVQAPAAGWIKDLVWKGKEGLWALVEWTQKAKDYLDNREYRYFSPVMALRASDRKVIKILNLALTNSPMTNNLRPIVAKLQIDAQTKDKEGNMLEKLKKMLGLAADTVEEKVIEAIEISINKLKALETAAPVIACKEVLDALGAKAEAGKEEVIQIVASLKAPGDVAQKLSLQVADLTKELAGIKQNDLITLALKEGKTSPDELDKWGRDLALKNPESFKTIVLSRPAGSVIPVADIIDAKDKDGIVTDEVQAKVNKQMGVSEEVFKKYNKTS
ncbi:MAG: phage protease [Victivallales bacterium]|jgi:phage I-like protein